MITKRLLPKSIYKFYRKNKELSIIAIILLVAPVLVVFFSIFKTIGDSDEFVQVKIKVSQGLWWASTQKPSAWMTNAIKKGQTETSLMGKSIVEVLEVKYYPGSRREESDPVLYDIYITAKINIKRDNKNEAYVFKRSKLAVGSPIELEFPSAHITGTVVELGNPKISDRYVEKTVTILGKDGYTKNNPHLYSSISVGDYYHNGESVVFEIIDKQLTDADIYESVFEREMNIRKNIVITARLLAKEEGDSLYFGEEQLLNVGLPINVVTQNSNLIGFVITKVD